ncbi:hypothetical protein FHG87_025775 [Trinorchestia longiramus]|nr:hypothetical protein FHG87_025775 [Trinorchestia longiramus]
MQLLVLETTQTPSTLFIFKALITTPKFPEPPSYCPIPCGLFSPCSVDIGRSFGGVVPKFELVQHIYNRSVRRNTEGMSDGGQTHVTQHSFPPTLSSSSVMSVVTQNTQHTQHTQPNFIEVSQCFR